MRTDSTSTKIGSKGATGERGQVPLSRRDKKRAFKKQERERRQMTRRTLPNKDKLTTKLNQIFQKHVVNFFRNSEGSLFAVPPVPAEFDQMQLSLYSTLPMEGVKQPFVQAFGKPKLSQDERFWIFATGIGQFEVSTNRDNTKFFHTIKLRDLEILPLLEPVFARFANRPDGKAPVAVSTAEVKFDLPLPAELSYPQAEHILDYLALYLVPYKNRYAGLSIIHWGELEEKSDDSVCGKHTFNFGKLVRYTNKKGKKEWIVDKKISSWSGTVYLKSFNDENGPWHIRLEVQLRDNALIKKIEGKALSCDPAVMLARLKKLRIFNFWRLESFNWEAFINVAQDSYATDKSQSPSIGKRISAKMLINDAGVLQLDSKRKQSLKRNHYAYSIRCKKTAHAIARRLGDIQLQTQINKGKFKQVLA